MPNRHRGTEQERRALDAFVKLVRAAETITSRLSAGLADAGLTVSQFGVLEALYHLGPMCQRELGSKILKSSGNITLVIDNLEKNGLVVRARDKDDRRFITVRLTEEGDRRIRDLFPKHAAAVYREMRALEPAERDELARLCRKLGTKQAQAPPVKQEKVER